MKTWYYYIFVLRGVIDLTKVPENKKSERKQKIEDEIKINFESIQQNVNNSNKFRCLLRELKINALEDILYGNHSDILKIEDKINPFPSDNEIIEKFQKLDAKYKYFPNKNKGDEQNFIALFKACKLVADYDEFNNSDDDGVAYQHAYKMMVLFGVKNKNPFDLAENFISQNKGNYSKPIHDLLVNDIPVNVPPIDLPKWQKLIRENGKHGIQVFQRAPAIEDLLKIPPNNIEDAQKAMSQLSYERFDEYPELATLCLEYDVDEELFNNCLSIKPKEKADNLPEISIDGKTINQPGYHLVKLPIDDPRAYILGKITNCCQSIGGHSEKCVIDGITRENNGFYVLLKAKKGVEGGSPFTEKNKINYDKYDLVGQGYAWLSRLQNLTFDSWENLTPDVDNKIIILLLTEFAQKVLEQDKNIWRVTIGAGGKTPGGIAESPFSIPEEILEGTQYEDSSVQFLIGVSDNDVKELEKDLKSLMNKEIKIDSISTKQGQWIRELFINQYENYSETLEDYEQLLDESIKNIKMLELYYILHQNSMLTNEYIELVTQGSYSSIHELLTLLYKKNPEFIKNTVGLLEQVPYEADSFSSSLIILYDIQPDLIQNKKITELIMKVTQRDLLLGILSSLFIRLIQLLSQMNR